MTSNPIATFVFSTGSIVQSKSVDAAEWLFGDARGGWMRDCFCLADWATDAGFDLTAFDLPCGTTLFACQHSTDGFFIGVEQINGRDAWFATRDEGIASRILCDLVFSPLPTLPGLAHPQLN